MRGPGMDGDASASSPPLSLFPSSSPLSIFLPVDRGREKNPFVTFLRERKEKNGSAAHRRFQRFW